ncbi:MAG: CU044_2847 family protein [Pseudomonadota bacterium]
MDTIIRLKDGIDVEVEVSGDDAIEISSDGSVEASLSDLQDLLNRVVAPIANTYRELDKDVSIESAKVSIGVKVGVEGNFILAKSSASANIQVDLNLKAIK